MVKRVLSILLCLCVLLVSATSLSASDLKLDLEPKACDGGALPSKLCQYYNSERGETCTNVYEEYKENPAGSHFWAIDPDVTAQGKANERARQFITWVLNKNVVDDHPTLRAVWNTTRNLSYFFVLIMAAVLGIGFIIGQRTNFDFKIRVWPVIGKIVGALLFITFSASIVLLLIQFSELLTRFFIENLGGKDLFNIYFSAGNSPETNYISFIGCRDLNFGAQEAARSQMLLMKITNFTYYSMGVLLILRKIVLWFLLFVSPFLAILFPFVFIRNVGWIWIGVFFQWLFYGPLFALFLGALSKIWKEGIPFIFDFHRAGTESGYVYPTALNILYGGPAQKLDIFNSGNYVDTFAEYVITLIMLWAVILLPWLLLRIFRDYCCDGIYAMKNILLSMYDQMRGGNQPPSPSPAPAGLTTNLKVAQELEVPIKAKLETVEDIKKTRTEEITKTLNLSATKLTDVAKFETNKQVREEVKQNLDYLSNPTKAQTPTERQKYMNLRTELFSRAVKNDLQAKQLLAATAATGADRAQHREALLKTTPAPSVVSRVVSYKVKLPQEKISSITTSLSDSLLGNTALLTQIAQKANVTQAQAQTILSSLKENVNTPLNKVNDRIAEQAHVGKDQVATVVKSVAETVKSQPDLLTTIAQKEQVQVDAVQQIVQSQMPLVAEPEKHIEQSITIPSTISLEDYEEVKKMWVQQYEKGEVPVTENVTSRNQWVEQDIVFITNTLNKLLSDEEKLKIEGFDDVGFILPIFMINNLKGEELLVYLKAKLEAAKYVQEQGVKEAELTEKLKAKANEVLVDLPEKKQAEAEKTMTMQEELPEPDEKKAS